MSMQRMGVLLTMMVAVVAGCNRGGPTATPSEPKAANVSYEVRGEASITRGVAESGTFRTGKNTLELRGGRVFANGKDHGPVKGGDTVLLDRDGQLSVNGEKRSPE